METKKCPFCAEEIKAEAIKCKHCGSMLNEIKASQNDDKPSVSQVQTVKEVKAETKQKRKPVVSATFVILLFLIAGAVGGFYFYNHLELKKHDDEYKKDALYALKKLEELNARVETGINFVNYSEELGRLNYDIKAFEEKYNAQPEAQYVSYTSISSASNCFFTAAEFWSDSIDSEYGSCVEKGRMQKQWSIASEFIRLAKESLPEEGKEKAENRKRKDRYYKLIKQRLGIEYTPSPVAEETSTPSPTPSVTPVLLPKKPSLPPPPKKVPMVMPSSPAYEEASPVEQSPYMLIGVMKSSGSGVAMLKDYDGRTFEVRTGEKLPEDWIVSSINDKMVILKKGKYKQTLKIE